MDKIRIEPALSTASTGSVISSPNDKLQKS